MESAMMALIFTATFSTIFMVAVFIRQCVLNYNKTINDEVQRKNRDQEAAQLEQLRDQVFDHRRFSSHYKILGTNKEEISVLDNKIQEVLSKKERLIERYKTLTKLEAELLTDDALLQEKKEINIKLKEEIDKEIAFYDYELKTLQQRRIVLWNRDEGLQEHLLKQEQSRNASLDALYSQHTQLLDRIYLRHSEATQQLEKETIIAGTEDLKSAMMAPIHLLFRFFSVPQIIPVPLVQIETQLHSEEENNQNRLYDSQNIDNALSEESSALTA